MADPTADEVQCVGAAGQIDLTDWYHFPLDQCDFRGISHTRSMQRDVQCISIFKKRACLRVCGLTHRREAEVGVWASVRLENTFMFVWWVSGASDALVALGV